MLTADIEHITRLRVNSDGTGVRSVVFMHNCPLKCFWCCNPETRVGTNYKTLTTEQLNQYIIRDKLYFANSGGGITFSGGEPLLHSEFILEFINRYCNDFSVNIETSLYSQRKNIEELIPLVDEWYIDFKVSDEKKHREYTGKSNKLIKENLSFLSKKIDRKRITITYPMIPNYNTSVSNIKSMVSFLNSIGINKVSFNPYRKNAESKQIMFGMWAHNISMVDSEMFNSIKCMFVEQGFNVVNENALSGKHKCNYLKQIRRKFCKNNSIPLDITDCFFSGLCNGTCPQCESELDFINSFFNLEL